MQNLLLSTRIKELCKIHNMSIKTLLENCGMNRNTIYDLEKKGSFPSCDKISRMADYLECSVDYLLGRTNIKSTPSSTDSVPGDNVVFFNSRSPELVTIKKAGRDGEYIEQQFTIEQAEFINTILSQSEDSVDPRI